MDSIKSSDNDIKVIKIVGNNNIYTSVSVYLVLLAVTIYTIVYFFSYLLSYFLLEFWYNTLDILCTNRHFGSILLISWDRVKIM